MGGLELAFHDLLIKGMATTKLSLIFTNGYTTLLPTISPVLFTRLHDL